MHEQVMTTYSLEGKRVWVSGHNGMVGSALVRLLSTKNCEIITASRQDLDLKNQSNVLEWVKAEKIDCIFLAAAKVGGIYANNTYPADFLYDNLAIELNIVNAAFQTNVEKMLFLGSSCIYPREAEQPINEGALLEGPLEKTNEWYALAKIAGIKLCQAFRKQHGSDFISAMPTNLYGEGDNFHPQNSHVPAALLDRFHQAKIEEAPFVEVWGSGRPLREFLFVDDLAEACVFLMENYSGEVPVNIGTGKDVTIAEFAKKIATVVGYEGEIKFDTSKPDGTYRKVLDVSFIRDLGWGAKTDLSVGLDIYYKWYLENIQELRK